MPRFQPTTIENAPEAARPTLEGINKTLGMLPNMYATMANAPAVLHAFTGMHAALGKSSLSNATREQIAVAVAGANTCDYCASAHTLLGKMNGVDENELARNLHGESNDAQTQAILSFATTLVEREGFATDENIQDARNAGLNDQQILEIIAEVAINIFSNYFNHVAQTVVDFPLVETGEGAAVS